MAQASAVPRSVLRFLGNYPSTMLRMVPSPRASLAGRTRDYRLPWSELTPYLAIP